MLSGSRIIRLDLSQVLRLNCQSSFQFEIRSAVESASHLRLASGQRRLETFIRKDERVILIHATHFAHEVFTGF